MKYNKSNIMKEAWKAFKAFRTVSFGICLHRAWEAAKKALRKVVEEVVEKPVEITIDTIKAAANKLVAAGEYEKIQLKEWTGYNRSRIYIKAIRYTLAGNIRIADCGYWDNDNNQYVPEKRGINLMD